jgi:nucleoside-diphosphate-sugar epimerase
MDGVIPINTNIPTNQLHVVLGASGAIGREIIKELKLRGIPYKAVERAKDIEGETTVHADASNIVQLKSVLTGATHVYCTVGLKYETEIWKEKWPIIADNLIEACSEVKAKLIFLDNIYMYGPSPLLNPITEDHPRLPSSKKGQIRLQVEQKLLSAFTRGVVTGVIARSADFYGPDVKQSMLYSTVLFNLTQNKPPQWLANPDIKHTYTFTPDAGKACVILALDENANNQVWHLPTSTEVFSSRQLINMIQNEIGTSFPIQVLPRWSFGILGIFVPILRELKEMLYQLDEPYIFSSHKFAMKYPNFKVTNYAEGIKEVVSASLK